MRSPIMSCFPIGTKDRLLLAARVRLSVVPSTYYSAVIIIPSYTRMLYYGEIDRLQVELCKGQNVHVILLPGVWSLAQYNQHYIIIHENCLKLVRTCSIHVQNTELHYF